MLQCNVVKAPHILVELHQILLRWMRRLGLHLLAVRRVGQRPWLKALSLPLEFALI
jgi:hypothetical protein